MSSFPFIFLFSRSIIFRTVLAISSCQWIILWFTLELNLFSFIPLISISNTNQETEARIKYFLVQAVGSRILLTFIFLQPFFYIHRITYTPSIFILLRMFLKLGLAPLHFWFPPIISSLNWLIALVLSTWQKIIPFFILLFSNISKSFFILIIVRAIRALIGGWGGLNQTQLRPLLAYSSIRHLGWIISALSISASISSLYFLFYLIIISSIILLFWKFNINNTSFSLKWNYRGITLLIIIFSLLSLRGLPPFIGFIPKWIVILTISPKYILILLLLILGSLINLFYYLNIINNLYFSFFRLSNLYTFSILLNPIIITLPLLVIFLIFLAPFPIFLLYAMIILN